MATLLLLSCLLPYISPLAFPSFAILSLLAPILIFINIAFVIYWLIYFKKQFLLSSIILVIGWFLIPKLYKFTENSSSFNDYLKVMSYNVRVFNFWNWADDKDTPKRIKNFIKDQAPDIVLVQEYYNKEKNNLKYPYSFIKKAKSKQNKAGLAIFSKYPIINKGSLDFKKSANNAIY